jgi:hypothetical protein
MDTISTRDMRRKPRNEPQPTYRKRRKLHRVERNLLRLRVTVIGNGPEAGEAVVTAASFHGVRSFTVLRECLLRDSTIRVGAPLTRRAHFRLIEIPHRRQRQLAWGDAKQLVDYPPIR